MLFPKNYINRYFASYLASVFICRQDSQEYTTWKMFRVPNFLEVLEEFPSLEPSAAFLLSQLPLLKPRLYSISSSPQLHPNELHLTLTVLNYHTQGTEH
jgi:sulfite reductase alpha subunit-like flavoprotein